MNIGEFLAGGLLLLELYAWYWFGASMLYGYAIPDHVVAILALTVLALACAWIWVILRAASHFAAKRNRRLGMIHIGEDGVVYYTKK